MIKVHFIGRTFPEVVRLSLRLPDLKWKCEDLNIEPTFRVVIANTTVNVECDLDTYENRYFDELYKRAADLARTAINLAAFATGYGLTVILESIILPDGSPAAIAPQDLSLAPLCTAYGLDTSRQGDLEAVVPMVATNPRLFLALNDLIESITTHHVAPVNCALAMDRLKHLIVKNADLKDAQAWKLMRDALQISEPYLKHITEASKKPRHGRPEFVDGTVTSDVTRRAWQVMDRYLEYRKRGSKPLPTSEFPLLT